MRSVTVEGDVRPITERPQANYRLSARFLTPWGSRFAPVVPSMNMTQSQGSRDFGSNGTSALAGQNPIGIRFQRAADNEPPFEVVASSQTYVA